MIGPVELNVIRVRAIEGRVIDPFRGDLANAATIHASRAVDSQPFGDALAAIAAMADAKVERQGRRVTLSRGDERLKVAFVSGAPRVTLDDLVLEGDGRLALAVMYALLPLFGPVEIRVGRYEDLIDGHEPIATVIERYDSWFVEDSLRVAKKLRQQAARTASTNEPAFTSRVPPPVGASVAERATRATAKSRVTKAALFVVAALMVVGLGIALFGGSFKDKVGETCDTNADCESNQCLPRGRVSATDLNGVLLVTPTSSKPGPGVCTRLCVYDSDCPGSMACRELVRTSSISSFGNRMWGCAPRAWDELPEPPR